MAIRNNLVTKIQAGIMFAFRYKIPKARIKYNYIIERRKYQIESKNIKTDANFEKQFNDVVVPYWKQFGVKPYKNCFKIFYKPGEDLDPRYISNDIWLKDVIPHFNNIVEYVNLANKSFQNLFVRGLNYPNVIVKRMFGVYYDNDYNLLTNNEICKLLKEYGCAIIKQSIDSYGGLGVEFVDFSQMSDDSIMKMLDEREEDFIVQELIEQHEKMSLLNPTSINTIRILTFFHNGEVKVLSANLRIGAPKSKVDNTTSGGYACGVHNDGSLFKEATSRVAGVVTELPNGIVFEDFVIPNYVEITEKVKKAAKSVPYFKIIGWDIAIDKNGDPLVVEFNIRPEQNQKTMGPTFGDETEAILKEVYCSK